MHAVHDKVIGFIADPTSAEFEHLALEVFVHQFECIPAYRSVCERRRATPASIQSWVQIPPVPALAFKQVDLSCAPPQRGFLSSGTSQGMEQRSRHAMPDLRLYRAAATAGLKEFLFPDLPRMRILSLIPDSREWPDSSLAQMVDWAVESFGDSGSEVFAGHEHLDFSRFAAALNDSERDGVPVCIMTTTAALIRFFDDCRDHDRAFRLPHSSRLMDTGGARGRRVSCRATEFCKRSGIRWQSPATSSSTNTE